MSSHRWQDDSGGARRYFGWLAVGWLLTLLVFLGSASNAAASGGDGGIAISDFQVTVEPGQSSEGKRNTTITFHQNGDIDWYTSQCKIVQSGTVYGYVEPCLDESDNASINALLAPGKYELQLSFYWMDPALSSPLGTGIGRTIDVDVPAYEATPVRMKVPLKRVKVKQWRVKPLRVKIENPDWKFNIPAEGTLCLEGVPRKVASVGRCLKVRTNGGSTYKLKFKGILPRKKPYRLRVVAKVSGRTITKRVLVKVVKP